MPGGAAGGFWDQLETLRVSQGLVPTVAGDSPDGSSSPSWWGHPVGAVLEGRTCRCFSGCSAGLATSLGGLRAPDEEPAQGFRWQTVS